MKKILLTISGFGVVFTGLVLALTVQAATQATVVTTSLPSGIAGAGYSTRVLISSNGQNSPNIIVSNLPSGVFVSNHSAGWTNAIYGDGAKDSNGYYYVDLSGIPVQAGNYGVLFKVTDTYQTFEVNQELFLTINSAGISTAAHTNGTNILGADGTVYFLVGGIRRPYTSAGAFLSYGFNSWATVAFANSADLSLPLGANLSPRDGSLINDQGTVYVISGGVRYGFATAQAFLGLGYSFANVIPGDTSFLETYFQPIGYSDREHLTGTLVNDHGTIYLIQNPHLLAFPSMQVFNSWGFKLKDIVSINSYDKYFTVNGIMNTRTAEQLNP